MRSHCSFFFCGAHCNTDIALELSALRPGGRYTSLFCCAGRDPDTHRIVQQCACVYCSCVTFACVCTRDVVLMLLVPVGTGQGRKQRHIGAWGCVQSFQPRRVLLRAHCLGIASVVMENHHVCHENQCRLSYWSEQAVLCWRACMSTKKT